MYNKYLSPIVAVGLNYGKEALNKIEQSENPKVRYARGTYDSIQNLQPHREKHLEKPTTAWLRVLVK